jgi:hypothetical protein
MRNSLAIATILVCGIALTALAAGTESSERIHIVPRFAAGQVFRYNIQLLTTGKLQALGPIVDTQGATKSEQSINVALRLDVLSTEGAPDAPGPVRLRATYEKVAANNSSKSYDPDAAKLQQEYQKLQGHSIEFTLHSDGKITDVTGIKDIITNPARADAVNQWLRQMTLGASLPRKGTAIGEKWTSELPVENLPLTGIVWRTGSTFAQEEPCPGVVLDGSTTSGVPPTAPKAPAHDRCAIIYSHSQIANPTGQKDRTPEVYRENGLRTSGEWGGESEALTAISLRTGMVVSVTQNGSTRMDFTVSSVTTGNHVHYVGDIETQAQMTLTSESSHP